MARTMTARASVAILVVLGLASLRLAHLEADTPVSPNEEGFGVYVDEGYKTLDARNLSLFGKIRVNEFDQFAESWTKLSPALQVLYYAAFRIRGAGVGSARLVTVLFFVLFLLSFVAANRSVLSGSFLFLGLIWLGLSSDLFVYSRLALHPVPIIAGNYGLLFLYRTLNRERPSWAFVSTLGWTLAMTFLIKPTAPLYFFPLFIGLALSRRQQVGSGRHRAWMLLGSAVLLFGGFWLLAVIPTETRPLGPDSLHWLALSRSILINPLVESSSWLVAAGLFCGGHALMSHPGRVLGCPYRASLLLLATIGPLPLALISYRPLRYFIPFLPAYVLLVVEWLNLRCWRRSPGNQRSKIPVVAGVVIIWWSLLVLVRAAGLYAGQFAFVERLRDQQSSPFLVLLIVALLAMVSMWPFRRLLLGGRVVLSLVSLTVLPSLARDVHLDLLFLREPSYQSREIASNIVKQVPPDASVAGDWAPFFLLGTTLKVFYMSRYTNFPFPEHLQRLKPDYFLFSDTIGGRKALDYLEGNEALEVVDPILESRYVGRSVVLYPLVYLHQSDAGSSRR